jgi:AcrR family transcriptional regulator
VTDSENAAKPAVRRGGGKRERLASAAAEVFHHQGVEKTTLSDIAHAADVPIGNVYYYFKTKDELVEAAIDAHRDRLRTVTGELDRIAEPAERLKALIAGWIEQSGTAARYGCPFGTLATELGKREDGPERSAADVMRALIDWAAEQFALMGRADARELAVEFVVGYQGMSVLTHALRDPEVMRVQGRRLAAWIDGLG